MSSYRVSKTLRFEAAHRLLGYPGKCGHVHGHSYSVKVTVAVSELGALGMAIDFSLLKEVMAHVVDEWDHALILSAEDPLLAPAVRQALREGVGRQKGVARVAARLVTLPFNPTAENMASYFAHQVAHSQLLAEYELRWVRATMGETCTCECSYTWEPRHAR